MQNNRPHLSAAVFAAAVSVSLFSTHSAQAAAYAYTGVAGNTSGTATQWSAGTNWSSIPVSATDTALNFSGALAAGVTHFTNNDIAGDLKLNVLNFTDSGPASGIAPTFTISGNRLEFISNGVATPVLNIAATGTVSPVLTISNNLLLTNNLSITQSSAATLSGVISGAGSLTKTLGGALTLSGANTYSGGTTLGGGTILVGNNSALGTGAVTLSGGTLTNASGNVVTLSNNLIVANGTTTNVRTTGVSPTNSLTVDGAVTGSGILQSIAAAGGSGTIAFQGDFSQFTGTLNPFSNANLAITNIGGLTAASMNLGQATLEIGGATGNNRRPTIQAGILQVGALQGTGSLAASGGGLQVGALNTNTTFSGITSSSNLFLTKVGTGTLTLNTAATWASFGGNGLSVNGGTVVEDLANTATGTGIFLATSFLKTGGGTFSLVGKSGTNSSQTFGGTTVNAGSSAITASNSGANVLLQLGAITRVAGGTVDFTNPSGTLGATNGITTTTANNAAGILGGYATVGGTDWAVSGASATVPITAFSGYTAMVATGGSTTTNYSLAGTGSNLTGAVAINSLKITDTGAGQSLSLDGNNLTFSSAQGGLLYAGGASNAYTIYGGNGADGTGVIGGGAAAGNEFIVNVKSGSTLTITAPIIKTGTASTGFLTTAGGGTLILNGGTASTYSGTNSLNGGVVQISQDGNLGTGGLAMNGATLRLAPGGTYGGGTLFSNSRGIALGNNGGTIDTNGSDVTYGGVITGGVVNTTSANTAGGFSFTKTGSGTLTLTGANTYGGATIITGGTLSVDVLDVIQGANGGGGASGIGQAPNTAPYLILNGGTLKYTGGAATTDRHFTLGTAGGGIDASGTAGTALNWAGNTGSGGTAANAVALAGSGARTFALSGSNTGANTFAMILGDGTGGATSLAKSGAGKWVLSNVNTYTGATTVNGGTLLVNGSAANSAATVNSGGTLGGSGTVGSITLNAGGVLAPGNSIGTLSTNDGDLLWNGETSGTFGQLAFELGNADNSSDLLSLGAGMLDQGGGNVFTFDFLGTGGDGFTYTLITFGSTDFTVDDFSYTNLGAGLSGSFVQTANSLQFTVVPEPQTWALLGFGLCAVLGHRHFRNRSRLS